MNNNFDIALRQASSEEFSWLDSFKNPYDDYIFSNCFIENMNSICKQSDYTYHIGNYRIRKKIILILAAMLSLLLSGCVLAHYYIVWNETQNDNYGTLDVEFSIDESLLDMKEKFIVPTIPSDYKETERIVNSRVLMIQYENSMYEVINYSQEIGLGGMGSVSINNETTIFEEIIINGYKGYHSEHKGVNVYVWTDGYNLYTLQGTCAQETLLEITKSIKTNE